MCFSFYLAPAATKAMQCPTTAIMQVSFLQLLLMFMFCLEGYFVNFFQLHLSTLQVAEISKQHRHDWMACFGETFEAMVRIQGPNMPRHCSVNPTH